MSKNKDQLITEVVNQVMNEFPEGLLGNMSTKNDSQYKEQLTTFAHSQFIALYVQIAQMTDDKSVPLLEKELKNASDAISHLEQQIELASEDPDLKNYNELHNELIKVTTEKLMTGKMLEIIRPALSLQKPEAAQAVPVKRKLEAPKGQAPLPPIKKEATPRPTQTIASKSTSPRTSKEIKAQPVLAGHRKSPSTPTSRTEPPPVPKRPQQTVADKLPSPTPPIPLPRQEVVPSSRVSGDQKTPTQRTGGTTSTSSKPPARPSSSTKPILGKAAPPSPVTPKKRTSPASLMQQQRMKEAGAALAKEKQAKAKREADLRKIDSQDKKTR